MAMAIPVETKSRMIRIGAAFATGAVASGAQRVSPTASKIVLFGGGGVGLLAALTMRGTLADVGEGVACAAAASMGNISAAKVFRTDISRASTLVGSGGPRMSLLASGPAGIIPQRTDVPVGGYRSI